VSDAPRYREDTISEGVRVISVFDPMIGRWTTTIVGGDLGGWSMLYRDDEDPSAKHAEAIKVAKDAASHASDSQP
jgi:hypothetical protein